MNEKFDRDLSLKEREFMARHKSVCTECHREEAQGACALNMLRMAAIGDEEVDYSPVFEDRVLRKWRVQSTRESVRYWSPAFVGAVLAGLTVLAALQVVSSKNVVPGTTNPAGEAKLQRGADRLPLIDLDKINRLR